MVINIDSSKIDFLNSALGFESVLINGKRISKKFSFFGIKHKIKPNSDNLTLESKYKQFDKSGIRIELRTDGELIEKQIVKADNTQRIYWMLIGLGVVIGAYKLLNFLFVNLNFLKG